MLRRSDSEIADRRSGGLLGNVRRNCAVLYEALRDLTSGQVLLATSCTGLIAAILLSVRHEPVRVPPPIVYFAGLPVSGRLEDAQRAGFNDCFATDAVHLRCRRHAVPVGNTGLYEAAVDLNGSEGQGGFDQLVLWHDRDNHAVFEIANALKRAGWTYCYTGDGRWADQAIYTRDGSPVRVSMDVSYYSKRRLRMIPDWSRRERRCGTK